MTGGFLYGCGVSEGFFSRFLPVARLLSSLLGMQGIGVSLGYR